MSGPAHPIIAGISVLVVLCLCTGCVSTGVGDTRYENRSVIMNISHTGEPADMHVQVTAYRISNLSQEMFGVFSAPVTLFPGENTIAVPGELPPGSYKFYIYVFCNGDRRTAVIRDIVV
jgi:hypothetical protein